MAEPSTSTGQPAPVNILITVVSPVGRYDLALPGDRPVADLLPDVVRLTTGGTWRADAGDWQLTSPAGQGLSPGHSLGQNGVTTGSMLHLVPPQARPTSSDPGPAPAASAAPAPPGPPPTPAPEPPTPAQGLEVPPPGPAPPPPATAPSPVPPPAFSAPPSAPPVPPAPPPLRARTRALLPRRQSAIRRLGGALGAMVHRSPVLSPAPPPVAAPGQVPAPVPSSAPPSSDPAATGPLSPSSLLVAKPPGALARARIAWRTTDYLEELDTVIVRPRLRRCVTIAVVSPKGGVGKTTTVALLGTLLSLLRRDRIVAVDTNPDFGSLGRLLTPEHQLFVDDLLADVSKPELTLTEVDSRLGRAIHGLMVLPAPTDPARMARLDEAAYRSVIERLKGFAGIVLLDCGTGLQEPAAQAALSTCDQILLLSDAEPPTASLVAEASRLVARSGRPMVVVVNKMPARRARLDLDRLGANVPEAAAIVPIPSQPEAATHLAVGGFDWRDAPDAWKRACRELAVVVTTDWPRLGLTL